MGHEKQNKQSRPYVVAMVLGAALTALEPGQVSAAEVNDSTLQAVHDISRYCSACWRNARVHPGEWSDCTQEVFTRLLERVPVSAWQQAFAEETEERRELVRAIDTVKKRSQRAKVWHALPIDVPARCERGQAQQAEQRESLVQAAQMVLSPRQQRIIQLGLDGWPIAEIAQELCLPVARVSDEKYKALQKLQGQLSAPESSAPA